MQLLRWFLLIGIVAVVPYSAKAQFVSERSAINNITKGKWDKARSQLAKISQKDSIRAGVEFAWSRYFFSEANPDFQIDSAHWHIQRAISDFGKASGKEREKLLKIPVDSMLLIAYKDRIDSAAFARADALHTEAAYISFLERFRSARQMDQAISLRDEVAFADAVRENTYEAFQVYLKKYPESKFASEARSGYDRLLFETKTADRKLATFEIFLAEHPETPYRNEIEQQIFEKLTAGGDAASFDRFIRKYPTSQKVKVAKDILNHLLKEDERALMPVLATDSVRKVQLLERQYLVPFFKDDKFGFMNERGEELIKPTFSEIPDDYLCGNITDDLLIADERIVTRSGATLTRLKTDEVEPLGYGFALLVNKQCARILHVSGFMPAGTGCFDDARLLAKNYLLLKKDNLWAIRTLTGRELFKHEWNDIQLLGEVVALRKGNKTRLVKLKDLSKIADGQPPTFSKEYDDVKLWEDGLVWVKNGSEEGVLAPSLNEWIKPAPQRITPAFFGAVSQTAAGYVLHNRSGTPGQHFYQVRIQKPWVLVQQDGVWRNIDPLTKANLSDAFDSVAFVGPFFVGMRNDSMRIQLSKEAVVALPRLTPVKFLPGKDSLFFLVLEEADKKTVYNAKAEKLFTVVAEKIEFNNEGYFTFTQKQKRGLLSLAGKVVLKPDFDAIGTVSQNQVATLKDRKFGIIDLARKKEIKPEYDKNLVAYDKNRLIAVKNNLCALIGWDNRPLTAFEFEEINYWNDSTALVKKNFQWLLYNLIDKRVVVDKIKAFKWVVDSPVEKIMIIRQENKHGVLSNSRGIIIPATFSDIVNVGSPTQPLYFTEKHVEEAAIFVVIYYDKDGIQLRKHVYEGSDYEKIYCSGN